MDTIRASPPAGLSLRRQDRRNSSPHGEKSGSNVAGRGFGRAGHGYFFGTDREEKPMAGSADEQGKTGVYASPPCFMHELEDGPASDPVDPQARADVLRWRKAEREGLIAARLAVSADERGAMAGRIADGLDTAIGDMPGRLISLYWPFRGEPDLRPWVNSVIERGGRVALPVVVEKGRPRIFRAWRPGDKLEKGVWNIPIPADGPEVRPDVVIAPVVGFDRQRYRLGYGG